MSSIFKKFLDEITDDGLIVRDRKIPMSRTMRMGKDDNSVEDNKLEESKPELKVEPKIEPKVEQKAEPKPETKVEQKEDTKQKKKYINIKNKI